MKNRLITVAVAAAIIGGIAVLNQYEPKRLAESHFEAEEKAKQALTEVDDQSSEASSQGDNAVGKVMDANEKLTANTSADIEEVASDAEEEGLSDYRVKFECSNGDIVLDVSVDLAPIGAAQFKKAIEDGVYDGARFFRVIPGFMAQFGIPGDPEKAAKWDKAMIKDDPVKASNTRGTMSFATGGPNTRTTQLFINYGDNSRLDGMGFSPFARVIEGMDVADSIYSGYGADSNDQDGLKARGNAYLDKLFPKLDYIKKATILGIPAAADEDADEEVDEAEKEESEEV